MLLRQISFVIFSMLVMLRSENFFQMNSAAPRVSEETLVVQEEQETTQDAMIKRPDNYEEPTFYDRLIFVGDSRTVGMRDALGGAVDTDTVWSCKSAMGYQWMADTGIPQVEGYIEDNTAVILLMGVNDPANIANYVTYINAKAQEWTDLGADTYYAAVGPVSVERYVSNAQIEAFNTSLETSLSGVTYLDLYGHLTSVGFATTDGLHYTGDTYREIYRYVVDHLECDNGGTPGSIWG